MRDAGEKPSTIVNELKQTRRKSPKLSESGKFGGEQPEPPADRVWARCPCGCNYVGWMASRFDAVQPGSTRLFRISASRGALGGL